ncbi:hypothetical protein PCASD_08867 [Puccinia coronata f. sp. avenae]|uniref:Uncharacterized protein n=1 Tax=Puccinia coronata f. sp. avenae TaxID=200324 RepID=A0A2N5UUM3_9BASI|nr:hypothetical protein PCASD_08867 [Puccinia coronata f. sp. avenae]
MSDPSATPNFDSNSQASRANSQAPPSNQQALAARSAATSRAKAANPPLILPSLPPGVAPVPRGTPAGSTSTPNSSQSAAAGDKKAVDVQALAALKKKYEEGCNHLSSILKEAEDILGDRVSHHKKAWSAAETTFKTSVSKWETQIAAAKTPTIDVEAEYAAVLPSIQIPKKRAAPGTSTKNAPRRRAKKNSAAGTVEEIVGITGVDDMSISQLAGTLGDDGTIEPNENTQIENSGSSGGPETIDRPTARMEERDVSTSQQQSAAEKQRAKEREEARAKAESEKTAAMLAGPASFLGDAWKPQCFHVLHVNASRGEPWNLRVFMVLLVTHREATHGKRVAFMFCLLNASRGEFNVNQTLLGQLDPKNPNHRNTGKSGDELGGLLQGMVCNVIETYTLDHDLVKHLTRLNAPTAERLSPALMAAPHCSDFADLLKTAPRLVQVSFPDIFWSSENVNFATLKKALDAAFSGKPLSGSWFAVLFNLLRTNSSPLYTELGPFPVPLRHVFAKVNQAVIDSVSLASMSVTNHTPSTRPDDELKSCRDAADYLAFKINGLGPSAGGQGQVKSSSEGLFFLIKRIHHIFLALSLCFEATAIIKKETNFSKLPAMTLPVMLGMKKELMKDAFFWVGPKNMSAHNWSIMKREAYASLATFMLYGVTGLWSVFVNYRKFNAADTYGLMTLAEKRAKAILEREDAEVESAHPLVSGGWSYLNSFIIDLIIRTDFTAKPDWEACKNTWLQEITPSTIARLVLADVYLEIRNPGASLAAMGFPVPPVSMSSDLRAYGKNLVADVDISMITDPDRLRELEEEEAAAREEEEDEIPDGVPKDVAQYMDRDAVVEDSD